MPRQAIRHVPNVPLAPRKYLWESKVPGDILLGKVKAVTRIGLDKVPCLQVKVPENRFFEYGKMFYRTWTQHWTLDPDAKCVLGDVIVIKKANDTELYSSTVPYLVDKIVFKHGHMVDPLTKRRNYLGSVYEDEVKFRRELVQEIYNEPLGEADDSTHEERRELIRRRIGERLSKKKATASTSTDDDYD